MRTDKIAFLKFGGLLILIVVVHVFLNRFVDQSPSTTIQAAPPKQIKETLRDHVIRTGVIRSGWLEYSPYFMKDLRTGKFTGIFYDITNELGNRLGLRVDWTEEVGYGTMLEGLKTKRYDLIGCGIWANSSRAREADFTIPVFFSPVGVIVRSDDNRFPENDLSILDNPAVTIATIDGEMSDLIANAQFNQSKRVSLPQMSHVSQNLLNVAQGKADATFCEPHFVEEFNANNSTKLKNIAIKEPVRIFGNTIVLPTGEPEFKAMLDTVLDEMINSGFVERILRKYEKYPKIYYRVAPNYRYPDSSTK